MLTGKISSLNADKGFGFITPSSGGTDVFFHCSAVDAEFTELKLEQAVQYEHDSSAARPRAKQVLSGTKNPRRKNPPTKRSALGSGPERKSAGTTNRSGITAVIAIIIALATAPVRRDQARVRGLPGRKSTIRLVTLPNCLARIRSALFRRSRAAPNTISSLRMSVARRNSGC